MISWCKYLYHRKKKLRQNEEYYEYKLLISIILNKLEETQGEKKHLTKPLLASQLKFKRVWLVKNTNFFDIN